MPLGIDKAVYKFLSSDGTDGGTTNMATTAGTYYRGPAAGRVWHIERIVVNIEDAIASIKPNLFGGLSKLTNGCKLEAQRDGGVILSFTDGFPIKQNADWGNLCYDVSYQDSGNAANTSNVQARFTFGKAGQPLVLKGSRLERLAIVTQDDLSALEAFTINVQGYEVS